MWKHHEIRTFIYNVLNVELPKYKILKLYCRCFITTKKKPQWSTNPKKLFISFIIFHIIVEEIEKHELFGMDVNLTLTVYKTYSQSNIFLQSTKWKKKMIFFFLRIINRFTYFWLHRWTDKWNISSHGRIQQRNVI